MIITREKMRRMLAEDYARRVRPALPAGVMPGDPTAADLFEIALHEGEITGYAGTVEWLMEHAPNLVAGFREFIATVPDPRVASGAADETKGDA